VLIGCSESLAAGIVETQCWIHKISGSSRESGPVNGDQGSYEQDLLLGTERRKRLETLVRFLVLLAFTWTPDRVINIRPLQQFYDQASDTAI